MTSANPIRHWARTARAVARKDLRTEARRRTALTVWLTLGVLCAAAVRFTIGDFDLSTGRMTPAVAWLVVGAIGTIAMGRSYRDEHRLGGWHGIHTTPAPRGAVYLGKFLSNLVLMLVAMWSALAAYSLLTDWQDDLLALTGVATLGTIGVSAVGTFSAATRSRLGLVGLVLALPVIALAAEATREALNTSRTGGWSMVLSLLVGYTALLIVGATASFGVLASAD